VLQLGPQRVAARGVCPSSRRSAKSQRRQVIADGAVDQFGGGPQLVSNPMDCCDVDPGAVKSGVSYSTLESHA
jgi:hypothetical protein